MAKKITTLFVRDNSINALVVDGIRRIPDDRRLRDCFVCLAFQ